jgi:hypothetical protein
MRALHCAAVLCAPRWALCTARHCSLCQHAVTQHAVTDWQRVCAAAADTPEGGLVAHMLDPAEERWSLERVRQHPFFCDGLPMELRTMTADATADELPPAAQAQILADIRDLVVVSRAPAKV